MISTLFIAKQVAFVRNYDVGLQKENIVVLPAKEQVLKSREAFVRELVGQAGVVNVTFATGLPSRVENIAAGMEWEGMDASLKPAWSFVGTDDRYLDTLGLTLVEGRNFPEAKPVQEAPYFIVNQRAVEEMKLKRGSGVGARFSLWGWNGTIIGIVKDFHFRSLHEEVKPLLLFVFPRYYNRILVKIRPTDGPTSAVLKRIGDVWEKFAAGIAGRINREFLTPILLSNLIAWPVAYRATLTIGIFLLAGLAALAVASIMVSFQAIRAARANPVQSL